MRFFDTRLGRCATLLALSGIGGGTALYAQGTQTASATITVLDKSGAPVANARIRLTSPNMMSERAGVTNSSGVFIARLLPPGTYTIEVIKEGFQTAKNTRPIGMDQHYQPRIILETVAGATVEVVATASSAIDPTDVKSVSNYDAKKIDELPTGRTPDAVALLTPGVTTGVGGRTQVRGAMTSGNLYLLDGQRVADNTYNTNMTHLVADSFEETQVMTGAISAEYGEVDGGVINTITKSGGNVFTGQFRLDLSNPQWNAVRAGTTAAQRNAIQNYISEVRQYTLGGFIVKDRLWFHASVQTQDTASTSFISASAEPGPTGAGAGYTAGQKRQYLVGKLTYRINDDHTVIGTYTDNEVDIDNRNYGAGHLKALGMQREESGIWNASWRAIWSPTLNSELRFGGKRQMIAAGPKDGTYDPNNIMDSPIREYTNTGLFYNNGPFTGTSQPDDRDNISGNAKVSFFANWMGTHEMDFGYDYYQGTRKGTNAQSVTGYTFFVHNIQPDDMTAAPRFVIHWFGKEATSTTTTMGIYANDKWKLDNHWAFQVGFRFDNYKATATDTDQTSGASGFSPRLGATYDLFGDQQLIFKASYCLYNASVLEVITGVVSGAGNIGQDQLYYDGPGVDEAANNKQPWEVVMNLDHYPTQGSYADPIVNVFINPNMKAPTCQEIQLGATYSLFTDDYGQGYVGLTYVNKTWDNLIDYSVGNHGQVDHPLYPGDPRRTIWIERWDNSSIAKRDYTGLELVADWTIGKMHVGGNITWSSLKGNYEGEGSSNPGVGAGLNYFRLMRGEDLRPPVDDEFVVMYESAKQDPIGRLSGDKPIVMSWTADYVTDNRYGRTAIGFIYSFESGTPFSYSRSFPSKFLNPQFNTRNYGDQAGQYMYDQRTHGRYNSGAYHDLSITHDFNLFKVAGTQVRAFAKIIVYNFLNHQQLLTWENPSFASLGPNERNRPYAENNTNWSEDSTLDPTLRRWAFSSEDFGYARQFRISIGVRF
jgi:outer membrane receptor for ferrienterochelin and colicin